MKFEIHMTCGWTSEPEPILKRYPCLEKFNPKIEAIKKEKQTRTKDERGRNIVQVSYYEVDRLIIDVETVEKLVSLMDEVGADVIVGRNEFSNEKELYIEIYDDYRE